MRRRRIQQLCKRFFDIVLSLLVCVIALPVFALIALLIWLDTRGPIFFVQERVGKNGRPFRVYKFRTMVLNTPKGAGDYILDPEDLRITRVGKLLRRASLDELPQLINVLKGEMSLVGPRPTLSYQVEQYTHRQWRRLEMKPGITGWAQINGRNLLSWPERIELDIWYVDNWSLGLDLKILLKTPLVLLSRQGIYGARENFVISPCDSREDE